MEGFPQNKKESGVTRVIGVGDKEERKTPGVGPEEEKILKVFKHVFEGHEPVAIEKEKSSELKGLIENLNNDLKEFLAKYGVEALRIPAANIHIVDWAKVSEEQTKTLEEKRKKTPAWYIPDQQGMVLLRGYGEGGKIRFTQELVHEMLHVNAFQSYQVASSEDKGGVIELVRKSEEGGEEKIRLRSRRVGFSIRKGDGDRYFNGIDEALIEELVMRFEQKYFEKLPELEEEYKAKKELFERKGWRWGSEEEKEEARKSIVNFEVKKGENGEISGVIVEHSYRKEREELNKLIDDLYGKNRDEFSLREGVFDMFAKAAMTGKLLPVGDLITKTYGLGSFRELGEKTIKNKHK
jgi:hypothetical protein